MKIRSAQISSTQPLAASVLPGFSGDVSAPLGSSVFTLATVNSNVGSFGSATAIPTLTVDGKGRITAIGAVTIPAVPVTGTSGHTVPYLDTANAWSGQQSFTRPIAYASGRNSGLIVRAFGSGSFSAISFENSDGSTQFGSLNYSADGFYTASNIVTDGTISATNIGTAAAKNTGTNGSTVPLLDGTNTWSNAQTFSETVTISSSDIATSLTLKASPGSSFVQMNFTSSDGNTLYSKLNASAGGMFVYGDLETSGDGYIDGSLEATNVTAYGTVTGSNLSGTNTGDQTITLTGDVTGSGKGSFAATLATVNANTGSFGSASAIPVLTLDGKGRITAASTVAIGTTVTKNIGTSGNTVPVLDGSNTWSAPQTISADGPQLTLNGSTSNYIVAANTGVAPPSYTTRSLGTKFVLFSVPGATTTDHAIGVDTATFWSSVPDASRQFKWYAGTAVTATLSGTGNLTITGSMSAAGTSQFEGLAARALNINTAGTTGRITFTGSGYTGAQSYLIGQGVDGISNGGFVIRDTTNGINRLYIGADGSTNVTGSLVVGNTSASTSVTTPSSIRMDNTYRSTSDTNSALKFYLYSVGSENYGFGLNNTSGIEYHASNTTAGNHKFYVGGSLRSQFNNSGMDMGNFPIYYTNPDYGIRFKTGGTTSENIASITTSNGNLHLDSLSGNDTFINYYRGSTVNIGNGTGGIVFRFNGSDIIHIPSGGNYLRDNKGSTISAPNIFNPVQYIRDGFLNVGTGGNSGVSSVSGYQWGYQEAGDWSYPYPDLVIGYHTGMKLGALPSYGGVRFYDNHPSLSSTELFSIGNGDSSIRVANRLYTNSLSVTSDATFNGGIYVGNTAGVNGLFAGNGDAATFSTHNVRIKAWFGLGFSDFQDTVRTVYNARSGEWNTTGDYLINGNSVWSIYSGQTAANWLFNNGGADHGSYLDMNASPVYGTRFYGGAPTTNTPSSNGDYYSYYMGLGSNYAAESYGLMMSVARGANDYLWIRRRENGNWNAWTKISAGYADGANSATYLQGYGLSSGTAASTVALRDGSGNLAATGINTVTSGVSTNVFDRRSVDGGTAPWYGLGFAQGTGETRVILSGYYGIDMYADSRPINIASNRTVVITSRDGVSISGRTVSDASGANTIPTRDANGFSYFSYINTTAPKDENATVDQVITTNGDGFLRKNGLANFISQALNKAMTIVDRNSGIQFRSNSDTGNSASPPLQVFSTGGAGAMMSFHRGGAYAVNMGLDSDNVLRIGGWSAPANVFQLDMSGNQTLLGNLYLPNSTATIRDVYRSGNITIALSAAGVWAAAAPVALTDAATIAIDMSTFLNATMTIAGNRTLGTPANAKPGQSGYIAITQDATGSRTLAYASGWKFAGGTVPSLTTTANALDILHYEVLSSSVVVVTGVLKDVK